MNKAILVGLAVTTLMGNYAYAADLPVKAPPAPVAPVYTWTGCYLGGNLGWARAKTRLSFNNFGDDFSRSSDGFAGGGQVGCDYQFGSNFVFGVQGMFDGTSIKASRVSRVFPADTIEAKVDWFATVAARFGYVFTPTFMVYGKVGWGTYDSSLDLFNTATGVGIASLGKRHSGLDAGAGFEWMFTQNWSAFVEWDHIFAKDQAVFFPNLGVGGTPGEVRRDFDKVLVGLNWRFGGYGSSVRAAY
jgi:outer membrane immunogenic protein